MLFVSSEQKNLLSIGRVPMRRKRLVKRTQLLDKFARKINEFCTNPDSRWLMLCGLPGSGKTQLLNCVLWEKPELCLALFGRVIWLTDRHFDARGPLQLATDCLLIISLEGQSSTNVFEEDEEENNNETQFRNGLAKSNNGGIISETNHWRMIGHRLRTALENIPTNILLILDGVMSSETVRFFEEYKANNCKLLATSTSSDLFDMADGLEIFHADELSVEELAQLLDAFGFQGSAFPRDFLRQMLAQTGGNLALLEKFLTMAKGQTTLLKSLLTEFSSCLRPLCDFSCVSPYPFTNLERPIQLCTQMLAETLSKSFDYCNSLEPFVWIPFEVFSLIWPLDVCGSESKAHLSGLIAHQLQTVTCNSLLDPGSQNHFRLQPLVHIFLLHSRPNSHKIFIRSAKCLIDKSMRCQHAPDELSREATIYLARNESRLKELSRKFGGQVGKKNKWQSKQILANVDSCRHEIKIDTINGKGMKMNISSSISQWFRSFLH